MAENPQEVYDWTQTSSTYTSHNHDYGSPRKQTELLPASPSAALAEARVRPNAALTASMPVGTNSETSALTARNAGNIDASTAHDFKDRVEGQVDVDDEFIVLVDDDEEYEEEIVDDDEYEEIIEEETEVEEVTEVEEDYLEVLEEVEEDGDEF